MIRRLLQHTLRGLLGCFSLATHQQSSASAQRLCPALLRLVSSNASWLGYDSGSGDSAFVSGWSGPDIAHGNLFFKLMFTDLTWCSWEQEWSP